MNTSMINFFLANVDFIRDMDGSQHSLLVMTEKFKESIDKSNAFGAPLLA